MWCPEETWPWCRASKRALPFCRALLIFCLWVTIPGLVHPGVGWHIQPWPHSCGHGEVRVDAPASAPGAGCWGWEAVSGPVSAVSGPVSAVSGCQALCCVITRRSLRTTERREPAAAAAGKLMARQPQLHPAEIHPRLHCLMSSWKGTASQPYGPYGQW